MLLKRTNISKSASNCFYRHTSSNSNSSSNSNKMNVNKDLIIFTQLSHSGLAHLNRAEKHNSLNIEMVRLLTPKLLYWRDNPHVHAVFIEGRGDKAFCAGGDIVSLLEEDKKEGENSQNLHNNDNKDGGGNGGNGGKGEESIGKVFFREEYQLNNLIGTYPKPYIALMDGITMGGGVGLSVHGDIRVATERTVFAMPETAIGFFPDVGGSWFLPRISMGFGFGMWLALTGARLKSKDVVSAGIATHFIPSDMLELFKTHINTSYRSGMSLLHLKSLVGVSSEKISDTPPSFAPHINDINKCFGSHNTSVPMILKSLQTLNTPWANEQLKILRSVSPTAVMVTFQLLHKGAKCKSLAECLAMEYNVTQHFMAGKEFHEGVKAKLVEKRNAIWNPKSIEGVKQADIDTYFTVLPGTIPWTPLEDKQSQL